MHSFDILTLFPSFFEGPLKVALLQKAIVSKKIGVSLHDLRSFATDRHRTMDDTPYGGGPGMLMKVEPVVAAIEKITLCQKGKKSRRLLLSPQGNLLTQSKAKELAAYDQLVLVCGRYEGVDARVVEGGWIDEEISIGDYVVMGGEAAALVLIEAVVRWIPGVVGDQGSVAKDTLSDGQLKHPQYTRPEDFRGLKVPEILLSGNHKEIENWRQRMAKEKTGKKRPDLLKK
ncbi:MAG: tRNA (guanosine(37)-N1)-methyltransferase TrmD [Deltaproteobacteria bacterium]|nr:tRNA (guanosine(37)-N1)-methyltransferase TrmD [Deltaproteobacteria bacterium]